MPKVQQCLILAAGNGSRLVSRSSSIPKPLVRVHGMPLLERIIISARAAGICRFVIVVGYRGEVIRRWCAQRSFADVAITFVDNCDYHKDNGISVLKARSELRDPFLLLMADHIFESRTAKSLLQQPLGKGEVILAVDSNLNGIFDVDDVTKVRRDGDHIVDIGKQITEYDAFDTGMFLCSPELFSILESAKKNDNCSLSDGMRELGQARRLRAFDIGDASWQDVDTPEALAYTEALFDRHFCTSFVTEAFVNV